MTNRISNSEQARDIETARRLRDTGIESVNAVPDTWFRLNAAPALAYAASTGEPFTVDYFRYGDVRPPNSIRPRAWGGRMVQARRAGVITSAGAARSSLPTSHMALVHSWVGTETAQAATPEAWVRLLPDLQQTLDFLGVDPIPPRELCRRLGLFVPATEIA